MNKLENEGEFMNAYLSTQEIKSDNFEDKLWLEGKTYDAYNIDGDLQIDTEVGQKSIVSVTWLEKNGFVLLP